MSKLLVSLLCAFGSLSAAAASPERFYIVDTTKPVDLTFTSAVTWNAVDLYVAPVVNGVVGTWDLAFHTVNPSRLKTGATLSGSGIFSHSYGDATELAFRLDVTTERDYYGRMLTFYSGAGLSNPADNASHTISTSRNGVVTVGFEDTAAWNYSDNDFNDLIFWSTNLSLIPVPKIPPVVPGVPEPETYAMLLAGLALTGAVARRRNRLRV
ncbi:MAG: DUF4114 domain-containing protein [Azoarcus sp.]|jgi:hypothetical protein|nr:DUF4114 domain-containing protein [Azoarcus sp.]